jgi:hypothetical protein
MNQPMATPPVYAAAPADVRLAVEGIRDRVSGLAEPRLYQVAVALTVLSGTGEATRWHSWGSPPPGSAKRFGRAQLVGAMWQLFGTATDALLHPASAVGAQLGNPKRVMLDVLYGANGPLTLVGSTRVANDSRKDSAKLTVDHGSWLWSSPGAGSPPVKVAEYNPVNSLGQQNGIGCALPASAAVASAPDDPASIYAVPRPSCPNYRTVAGSEPICAINNIVCGGQGDGAARERTKPRLLAPPTAGSDAYLVLPGTITALVAQATRGSRPLPLASDLSLLVSWCHTDGSGAQDASRLASLLGGAGIKLLTSTT